jgi:aspartate racemase
VTRTVGIIGGIAPESTVAYYRQIIQKYREKTGGYPSIIINSIDLQTMLGFVGAKDFEGLIEYLMPEINRVAEAGVDFALFASNTPHIVFDDIARRSPVPLLSIVECARDAAADRGFKRAGLLGTRFTMEGQFYKNVFATRGIEVIAPPPEDLAYVHDHYMSELVQGDFREDTRAEVLRIIERLATTSHADAVILGGTELPLLLDAQSRAAVPLLDTTAIHVDEVIRRMT